MPGLKRTAEHEVDGDGTLVTVDGASSSLRQDSRKKVRLSVEQEPVNLYDEDFDDESDEELEIYQASQFHEKQKRIGPVQNRPAQNGIIESITCQNFMCHSYLHVDIGPLINFVVGANGSGKSAVLTALTICLGGKASSTNRAGSLKDLIKEGEEQSIVTVKIKNKGETGYQTEVWGDTIIVERSFSRSGSSTFKLKNDSGRIISTKKSDLDGISDYYSLQIDNPISVLTQDMARQFLNSSTPADKYKFFMKGVQLEQLGHDYELFRESIDAMEGTFDSKKDHLDNLKERAERAHKLFEMSEKHDGYRTKLRQLGMQMAWSQVEDQERLLEKFDKDIENNDADIETAQSRVLESSTTYTTADQDRARALAEIDDLQRELAPIEKEKEKLREENNSLKTEQQETLQEQRKIGAYMKASKERITKDEKDIDEEIARLEQINGGITARRIRELDVLRAKKEAAEEKRREHEQSRKQLDNDQQRAIRDLAAFKPTRTAKNNELEAAKERRRGLENDRGRQRSGQPPAMPQLLRAIQQDQGFAKRPVGPLGDHIRLKKPMWSNIIEKTLGSALNAFIVTNKQDQARLSNIMRRVKCSSPIFIGSESNFDYSGHQPDSRFDTILRLLEIDSPIVVRQLIINNGIEQSILIENMDEARETMERERLRNVKVCYTMNNRNGLRYTYSAGGSGTLNSAYVDQYNGLPRMKTDLEYQIKAQDGVVMQLQKELAEMDRTSRDLQNCSNAASQAIKRHQVTADNLKIAVQEAETEFSDMQDELEADRVKEGRLDTLRESLKSHKDELVQLEEQYQQAVLQKDEFFGKLKAKKKEMDDKDVEIEDVNAKMAKAKKREKHTEDIRANALRLKNDAIDLEAQLQAKKLNLQCQRLEQAAKVTSFQASAGAVGPRVPVPADKTMHKLEAEMAKLKKDVDKFEAQVGMDKQTIAQRYSDASTEYTEALYNFKLEETLARLLKMTLLTRQQRWQLFKRYIAARARTMFTYLLSERGFKGALKINHLEKLLDLKVQPDETKQDRGGQTKGLSGGEKSFSTVCLLLALWDAIGAPIRCLDEFDVFMDSVNRDQTMKLIIGAARRAVERQFIFITPQSIGSVTRAEDLKIIQMAPPGRGQTTLPF